MQLHLNTNAAARASANIENCDASLQTPVEAEYDHMMLEQLDQLDGPLSRHFQTTGAIVDTEGDVLGKQEVDMKYANSSSKTSSITEMQRSPLARRGSKGFVYPKAMDSRRFDDIRQKKCLSAAAYDHTLEGSSQEMNLASERENGFFPERKTDLNKEQAYQCEANLLVHQGEKNCEAVATCANEPTETTKQQLTSASKRHLAEGDGPEVTDVSEAACKEEKMIAPWI